MKAPLCERATITKNKVHAFSHKQRGRNKKMKINNKYLNAAILPAFIIIIWFLVTTFGSVKPFFLPSLGSVLHSIIELFKAKGFMDDVLVSVTRISLGFFFAAIVAIPLGLILGVNKKVESAIEPTIDFIRYIPIPAYIPVMILWFGIGEMEKIIVIAFGTFVQLILMIASTVSAVPEDTIDFSRTLGVKKADIIRKIVLPLSAPKILDDLRISMGWAWSGLMMAEIVGSSSGIGYVIIQSQRLLKTDEVFSAIFVIGILGILTDLIFKYVQKVIFPWYRRKNYA